MALAPQDEVPVAAEWFVRRRVADGLTLISEPHVHPLLRCNVWLVTGRDQSLVIDTAMGLAPLRTVVDTELDGPLLAVATHAHSDHVGGLHEFEHRAIHGAEAAIVAAAGLGTLVSEYFGPLVTDPYRDAGYDIPEVLVDAYPTAAFDPVAIEITPAPATRLLAEGDLIDLGDRAFEVLHLPGHSPGSIGLWEASTGVLFSGDAVYDGPLLDELDGSDIEAYLATMDRLRSLPVSVVHGGHEDSFGPARLVELCEAYLSARGG